MNKFKMQTTKTLNFLEFKRKLPAKRYFSIRILNRFFVNISGAKITIDENNIVTFNGPATTIKIELTELFNRNIFSVISISLKELNKFVELEYQEDEYSEFTHNKEFDEDEEFDKDEEFDPEEEEDEDLDIYAGVVIKTHEGSSIVVESVLKEEEQIIISTETGKKFVFSYAEVLEFFEKGFWYLNDKTNEEEGEKIGDIKLGTEIKTHDGKRIIVRDILIKEEQIIIETETGKMHTIIFKEVEDLFERGLWYLDAEDKISTSLELEENLGTNLKNKNEEIEFDYYEIESEEISISLKNGNLKVIVNGVEVKDPKKIEQIFNGL